MNNWNKIILTISIMLLFKPVTYGQTALEIIDKADKKMQGNSSKTEMVMRLVRHDWPREVGIKG